MKDEKREKVREKNGAEKEARDAEKGELKRQEM